MFDAATDAAFHRTILDRPEDDAPRLVYADWLDENGDPDRAEFIRVQIQLSQTLTGDPSRPALTSRSQTLERGHFVEWVNRLPSFPGVHWEVFHRGFISTAVFESPAAFDEFADSAFVAAPIVELRLSRYYWQDAGRLAKSPHLEHVRVLDFENGNRVSNAGLEALMQSPYLANVSTLKLQGNALGSAGARAITQSPFMRHLKALDLSRNDLYDAGLISVAEAPHFGGLWSLDLERTRIGDTGLRALAESRGLPRLIYLDVSGNQITDDGVAALAASAVLGGVRELYMYANNIADRGAAALAASAHLGRVEDLFLHQNTIGDAGAEALARSPHFERLIALYLGGNRITDVAFEALRTRFGSRVRRY